MDELINRIHEKTGLAKDVCAKAIAIILNFLNKEGPQQPVQTLMERLPGARHILDADHGDHGSPGLLSSFGELMSGGEGIMTAFNDLTALGLDMGQIQVAVQEFMAFSREKVGDEPVDEIIKGMPALARLV